MPAEAQWEYACRAGTATRYWFGDECDKAQANFGDNVGQTSEVKSYAANPFGLFDVHGNVWEWCQDFWRDEYGEGDQVDPQGPEEGSARVVRGGSWLSGARSVRSASRSWDHLGNRYDDLGFRCMSSVSPVAEQVSASKGEPRDEAAEKQRTQ